VGWGELLCQRSRDARFRNIEGIVESGELLGLTPEAVSARFGAPRSGSKFGADQFYYVGPDSACIDSVWLALYVQDGVVVRARIATD
jgi:hypothetical protein